MCNSDFFFFSWKAQGGVVRIIKGQEEERLKLWQNF